MSDPTTILGTDLYQLTMLQCYDHARMCEVAVFEFFVRRLPECRNFLVAAGLEQALEFLEQARFTQAELNWLVQCGHFRTEFLERLAAWRFSGDVHALPEGTIIFANEPILRVTAPLPEAQLVESRLINLLQFQTLIASKAARAVLAAPGKPLVDFGFRRAHGYEAGLLAARATYLAGFAGTATVAAGREFGIPMSGTMAHSLVQAIGSDTAAFTAFARACPDNVVFLLDTFDTEEGARATVRVARELALEGIKVRSVRLDSGDLAAHARAVRRILDDGGLNDVTIVVSGGLDEYELARLTATDAPIDAFGVGTSVDVSADAPYLECVYKLVEYAGRPTRKRSQAKASWPGRKQIFRTLDASGRIDRDVITLEDDEQPGTPLLMPVMRAGRRLGPAKSLEEIRRHVAGQLGQLPDRLKSFEPVDPLRIDIAPALVALARQADVLADEARRA